MRRWLALILGLALCLPGSAPAAEIVAPISEIQGAGHLSPLAGQRVTTQGIVTALRSNGFFLQSPTPDERPATSEGIYVYTGAPPGVSVGDWLTVTGTVEEYAPGGATSADLSTTELTHPLISVISASHALPPPVIIGSGERLPPGEVIEDDGLTDFDPDHDGLDFYEALEGMRVQVQQPIVVGPGNSSGELTVLADAGAGAELRTPRGGIVVRPADANPERIILDNALQPLPKAAVGDMLGDAITGVMDYGFGQYRLLVTSPVTHTLGGLAGEVSALVEDHRLRVASFNIENLGPRDRAEKFTRLATQIVEQLHSPDILVLQEVQDNSGGGNDGTVQADRTYARLIAAIEAAGGPTYAWRDIAPQDNQDGGELGGNIRVGFLFRPERVTFVDRPGGDSTTPVQAVAGEDGARLSLSPGRIAPNDAAFVSSRKPLAGEFVFQGEKVFVIGAHLASRREDDPLFGCVQPPQCPSAEVRVAQARIIAAFVSELQALDPHANIIVAGDMNDDWFSAALQTLAAPQTPAGEGLLNLMETLPPEERYSYLWDGNSQGPDTILASRSLKAQFDVVHANAEFP
ncbi:MAG: hypothetical protein GX552_00600, partial [Chloroflexi bacterium]|nr:hypothetical protein [Chloroflexota bacterium]